MKHRCNFACGSRPMLRADRRQVLILCVLLLPWQAAHGVAYCSLRDPVNTIYELFPAADGYRSSVKTVGRDARIAVNAALDLDIHFNELGRHTLYVALKRGEPIGLIHARSESSRWGLTEFAWAITPELKISGLKVQRTRDPQLRGVQAEGLAAQVVGLDIAALKALHASSPPQSMLRLVVASALKTLVITAKVWRDAIAPGAVLATSAGLRAGRHFGTSVRFETLRDPYSEPVRRVLAQHDLAESAIFTRDSLHMFRVLDDGQQVLGLAVITVFDLEDPSRQLLWLLDRAGRVLTVTQVDRDEVYAPFQSVVDYQPESIQDCSSAAELGALELGVIARQHLGG